MKMRGGGKTDHSKTVYHSKHTMVNKPKSQRKSSIATDLPNSETILRILRMRPGKEVKDFLHNEFKRRNNTENTYDNNTAENINNNDDELNKQQQQDPSLLYSNVIISKNHNISLIDIPIK
ncbi:unnamed protein product [Cunninghamella echinulata]